MLTQKRSAYALIHRALTPCHFFLKDEAALGEKSNRLPQGLLGVSRASSHQLTAASHARGVGLDLAPTLLLSESPRPRLGRLGNQIEKMPILPKWNRPGTRLMGKTPRIKALA